LRPEGETITKDSEPATLVPGSGDAFQAPGKQCRQAVVGIICSIIGIAASSAFLIYILSHLDDFGIKLTR